MGKKLLVALTMEGKFAGEGLQSLDEDDDMLSAMARELVERNGIGDSADAVWRRLNDEHQRLFAAQASISPAALPGECLATPAFLPDPITVAEPVQLCTFDPRGLSRIGRGARSRSRLHPAQGSLF